jgi:methylphosphotriester-DNA--protein-cysteine methyltransferase
MAGMSVTKYKILFKKHLATTPKNIYIKEKFLLAKKMIESGNYSLLSDVMYELNYYNLNYFKAQYTLFFKRSPTKFFPRDTKTKITDADEK